MRALYSGEAFFAWDFAALRLPPKDSDPDGARILHEHAHVLTFAGTDFYSLLASQIIEGKELTYGHVPDDLQGPARVAAIERRGQSFAHFAEAVPEVLKRLGERTYEATLSKFEIANDLEECARQYRQLFDAEWVAHGLNPKAAWGPAAEIGGLSPEKLFNRFILLTLVHAILDATVSGPVQDTPDEILSTFRATLSGSRILLPARGMTVANHMRELLGIGQRTIVTMFDDHFRLASVLLDAPDDRLHQYLGLLPAVVGLEFLVESWPEGVQTSFFSNSADQPIRQQNYLSRRLRDAPARTRLSVALGKLQKAFTPQFDGLPVRASRQAMADPRIQAQLAAYTMQSFFRALPEFLGALLAEAPMFTGAHFAERLRWIEATSERAVSVFLNTAAKEDGLAELAIDLDHTRLRKAEDIRLGPIWLISREED